MASIQAGYKAINGYIFTQADADCYNAACAETARTQQLAGNNPSTAGARSIDEALDNQARVYNVIIGL